MSNATKPPVAVSKMPKLQLKPLRMLFVGPMPPPRTGTHVSFQLLCDAVEELAESGQLKVIDTSQKHQKQNARIASFANLRQCWKISAQFFRQVRNADYVLVFGSNGFIFSMTPILRFLAGVRPFYVHVCGGSLDVFAKKLNPVFRSILYRTLSKSSGTIVQTRYLRDRLVTELGDRVVSSPNRRHRSAYVASPGQEESTRIVYVSTVRKDKGIFVLLESLRRMQESGSKIQCDIYGEIWPADEAEFRNRISLASNAEYKGYVEPERVSEVMSRYDVLVLPTFYQGEGHPGVLVEAMMVGLPIISTDYRSIPEVVEHGVNGLLVKPNDVSDLERALTKLDKHSQLQIEMSAASLNRRSDFDAAQVLPRYLEHLGLTK